MDDQTLMPDVISPLRSFEVVLTVPMDADRGELVPPIALPPSVMGAWSATQAIFSVPVKARGLLEAGTLGIAMLGDLAQRPGVSAQINPVAL